MREEKISSTITRIQIREPGSDITCTGSFCSEGIANGALIEIETIAMK